MTAVTGFVGGAFDSLFGMIYLRKINVNNSLQLQPVDQTNKLYSNKDKLFSFTRSSHCQGIKLYLGDSQSI